MVAQMRSIIRRRFISFQMEVIVNPELERDLLDYGFGITVLSPQSLVESIRRHHKAALDP